MLQKVSLLGSQGPGLPPLSLGAGRSALLGFSLPTCKIRAGPEEV